MPWGLGIHRPVTSPRLPGDSPTHGQDGCESWTTKKAECQRTDAFELWCWRRLLRALGPQGLSYINKLSLAVLGGLILVVSPGVERAL